MEMIFVPFLVFFLAVPIVVVTIIVALVRRNAGLGRGASGPPPFLDSASGPGVFDSSSALHSQAVHTHNVPHSFGTESIIPDPTSHGHSHSSSVGDFGGAGATSSFDSGSGGGGGCDSGASSGGCDGGGGGGGGD